MPQTHRNTARRLGERRRCNLSVRIPMPENPERGARSRRRSAYYLV